MALELPAHQYRFPASTPLVSRSPMLNPDGVIVIEGAQFEDDRRRVVVGPAISDEPSMRSCSSSVALSAVMVCSVDDGLRRSERNRTMQKHTRSEGGETS